MKTIEQCFEWKIEAQNRINRIDNKIRDWARDLESKQNSAPQKSEASPIGPLNPDCLLNESDFSPITVTSSTMHTRPAQDQTLNHQRALGNFTKESSQKLKQHHNK